MVVDGLVDLILDVDPTVINGQALWLEVSVDGQTLAPRQELLPVPYALSVRPGASIIGDTSTPILSIHNENNIGVWASSNNESRICGQEMTGSRGSGADGSPWAAGGPLLSVIWRLKTLAMTFA